MNYKDKFLQYGRQYIESDDIEAVVNALNSDWLTTGPAVSSFETALCKITQSNHAISCSSGTAALHLSILALGLKEGDAVIVPAITFVSTANVVRMTGAEVIFADVDYETGLLDAKSLKDAIKNSKKEFNLKAVLIVHLNGQCIDYKKIIKITNQNNLVLIEDASHAIGTKYIDTDGNSEPVGSCKYGTMTTFSFHPVKTIAAGEAGAITTNNDDYAEKLYKLRNHGMIKNSELFENNNNLAFDKNKNVNPWYYELQEIGFNYRLSDIHAALGSSQLKKLFKFVEKRRSLSKLYDKQFKKSSHFIKPLKKNVFSQTAWHLYVVKIDFDQLNIDRSELIGKLFADGIGTQVHYIPVHLQPYYFNRYGQINLPNSELYYNQCLSLPLHVSMSEDDVLYVSEKLMEIVEAGK